MRLRRKNKSEAETKGPMHYYCSWERAVWKGRCAYNGSSPHGTVISRVGRKAIADDLQKNEVQLLRGREGGGERRKRARADSAPQYRTHRSHRTPPGPMLTKGLPTPDGTFPDSNGRDLSNAPLLGADALCAVEYVTEL